MSMAVTGQRGAGGEYRRVVEMENITQVVENEDTSQQDHAQMHSEETQVK